MIIEHLIGYCIYNKVQHNTDYKKTHIDQLNIKEYAQIFCISQYYNGCL